jgi:uncharacterized NAD(P)/FAD-binding protein YdhS
MTIAHSTAWKSAETISPPGSVAIVGGGASGVLMAAHLTRDGRWDVGVTIVEKRKSLGRGLAYSADLPDHVLNVRASNMSAFADMPDHFVGWLASRGIDVGDPATYFAPRRLYGEYLGELLDGSRRDDGRAGRLSTIVEECVAIVEHNAAVELRLADGSSLVAERCVLATGHDHRQCRCDRSVAPYPMSWAGPVAPSQPALIIGTGLSMVDACLSLILGGHTGPIVAASRRGLLPTVHARTTPVVLEQADVPIGADMRLFVRWFRELVAAVEAAGGGWRDVVDGLRPFSQLIWQNWSDSARLQACESMVGYPPPPHGAAGLRQAVGGDRRGPAARRGGPRACRRSRSRRRQGAAAASGQPARRGGRNCPRLRLRRRDRRSGQELQPGDTIPARLGSRAAGSAQYRARRFV